MVLMDSYNNHDNPNNLVEYLMVLVVVVFNGSIDIEDDNEFERADRSIGPS